ncbi:MAG TPA: ATP-binding cassette domain-containing protein [Ferruginibacter sp.]|nr:ATP-binding cassette domain-containing protein [Ferruginibacter sp.]
MAENATGTLFANPVKRVLQVIKLEKNEITSVYFYAILNGLIQLSLPLGIQSIISFVLGGTISTSLIVLICLVVLGVFINGLLQVNQMRIIEKVQQKIFVRYSFAFADRIPRLNLQALDGKYLPETVNRFFDTVILQKGISKLLLDIPASTIQIIFGLILLSFYHPIFILFGISLLLIVFGILHFTSARGMQSSLEESDYKYGVAGWLEEMARVIKSFKFSRNTTLNIEKNDRLVTGYLKSRTTHFNILLSQYWTLIAFKVIITAAMLIVGSYLLVNQQINIGQFIAAEIVILMVISSVEKLIINLDKVYDVLTSAEKLGKVIDLPVEAEGQFEINENSKGLSIAMTQVKFSYSPGELPVLNQVSLLVKANEKICVMGRAGSGKSTLLRLLTGVYRQSEGSIFINDLPIADYKLDSLRSSIGILFSQQDIFEGTLLENIQMGNKEISPNTILLLAEKIGLKKHIAILPGGFNTRLDPAGKKLSQKIIQKILLLRALVGNPGLLLLEEPFAGIEEEPRHMIIDYLLHQTPNQTVMVSSNDIEFAAQCDKVIFLQDGSVKAFGKWNDIRELIKKQA